MLCDCPNLPDISKWDTSKIYNFGLSNLKPSPINVLFSISGSRQKINIVGEQKDLNNENLNLKTSESYKIENKNLILLEEQNKIKNEKEYDYEKSKTEKILIGNILKHENMNKINLISNIEDENNTEIESIKINEYLEHAKGQEEDDNLKSNKEYIDDDSDLRSCRLTPRNNNKYLLIKEDEKQKNYNIIERNDSDDDNEEEEKEKEKEEKKEDDKEEEKDEKVDDKFYCYFNGKNNCFNQNDINKKIKDFEEKKDENVLNIPIILYLNTLRIVSLNKDEIKIIESKEDDEQFIPKHIFDYQIIEYLKKTLKIKPAEAKNKKITLSLYSQNRDLSVLFKEVDDQIKALSVSTINNTLNDADSLNYLRKIGFYPSELLGGYKVEYKLYDLCEQSLVYYLYLSYLKKNPPKKSVLFMEFDKLVVNAAIFNEGAIYTKLKGKKENDVNWKSSYFNNINTSDVNGVLDFLENVNDTFEGIDIVLSYVDINEEQKKKLLELFDTIKKHCQEKIKPPIKVLVYEQNQIANNVFNYMNLFYDN
jgi:hypothetical protein